MMVRCGGWENDGTSERRNAGTEETQMAADTARTAADNCGNPELRVREIFRLFLRAGWA